MSGHGDLGPELRALAQAILDRLDPVIRAAAAAGPDAPAGTGRCQQVWCPVCALAALISGEQHPLLTIIAEHSVTLLTVVRSMADPQPAAPDPAAPDGGPTGGSPPANGQSGNGHSRYQSITVVVEPAGGEGPTG